MEDRRIQESRQLMMTDWQFSTSAKCVNVCLKHPPQLEKNHGRHVRRQAGGGVRLRRGEIPLRAFRLARANVKTFMVTHCRAETHSPGTLERRSLPSRHRLFKIQPFGDRHASVQTCKHGIMLSLAGWQRLLRGSESSGSHRLRDGDRSHLRPAGLVSEPFPPPPSAARAAAYGCGAASRPSSIIQQTYCEITNVKYDINPAGSCVRLR